MWWFLFFVGCSISAILGFIVCAMMMVGRRADMSDLDSALMHQRLNLLKEEVDAAHKYFDTLYIPREVDGKLLSLIDRIGLAIGRENRRMT